MYHTPSCSGGPLPAVHVRPFMSRLLRAASAVPALERYRDCVLLLYSKDGPLSLERGLQSLEQLQKKVRVLEEENAELKTVV